MEEKIINLATLSTEKSFNEHYEFYSNKIATSAPLEWCGAVHAPRHVSGRTRVCCHC